MTDLLAFYSGSRSYSTLPAICDGWSNITITCPTSMYISSISSVFFGRSDTVTCPYSSAAAMKNITCRSPAAQSGLASRAVGLVSYTISSSAVQAWLPDPCVGTFKWFNATYVCTTTSNTYRSPPPPSPPPPLPPATTSGEWMPGSRYRAYILLHHTRSF